MREREFGIIREKRMRERVGDYEGEEDESEGEKELEIMKEKRERKIGKSKLFYLL